MEKYIDVDFVTAQEMLFSRLDKKIFEVELLGSKIEVDIWVEKNERFRRFNCPLFKVDDFGTPEGYTSSPYVFPGEEEVSKPFIASRPFIDALIKVSDDVVILGDVIDQLQNYGEKVQSSQELQEELLYEYKVYMGYSVEPRNKERVVAIARPGPVRPPKPNKYPTAPYSWEPKIRKRYDIGGFYYK